MAIESIDLTSPFNWTALRNLVIDLHLIIRHRILSIQFREILQTLSPVFHLRKPTGRVSLKAPITFQFLPMHSLHSTASSRFVFGQEATGLHAGKRDVIRSMGFYQSPVLNIHLPWSDKVIYWDAGIDSVNAYDRINKVATAAEYATNWVYWTFVKNVSSGRMKIYKNGIIFLQGTQKRKRMTGITQIRIGAGLNNDYFYDGNLDDFAIFNTEVSQTTLQQWMYKRIDSTHPDYSHLLLYYDFDQDQDVNTTVYDASPNAFNGTPFGIPQSQVFDGTSVFKNFSETNERPQIVFGQGVYNSYIDSMLVVDSTEGAPATVIVYGDTTNPTQVTDTLVAWSPYYNNYLYDSLGNAVDSSIVSPIQHCTWLTQRTMILLSKSMTAMSWEDTSRRMEMG
jgi:hypothetical protein